MPNTFINSFFTGLSLLMALQNGTYTTSSFLMPIITLRCPSRKAVMAPTPDGSQNTVVSTRRTATLQMPENRHAHVELGIFFLHPVGIIHGTTLGAFGHDDHTGTLALADTPADELFQLVSIGRVFGNDGSFRPAGYRTVLRQETGVAPITSMKNIRSCEVAVSRILSTHCTMVFSVVS